VKQVAVRAAVIIPDGKQRDKGNACVAGKTSRATGQRGVLAKESDRDATPAVREIPVGDQANELAVPKRPEHPSQRSGRRALYPAAGTPAPVGHAGEHDLGDGRRREKDRIVFRANNVLSHEIESSEMRGQEYASGAGILELVQNIPTTGIDTDHFREIINLIVRRSREVPEVAC
jgi:hypothetical protein